MADYSIILNTAPSLKQFDGTLRITATASIACRTFGVRCVSRKLLMVAWAGSCLGAARGVACEGESTQSFYSDSMPYRA